MLSFAYLVFFISDWDLSFNIEKKYSDIQKFIFHQELIEAFFVKKMYACMHFENFIGTLIFQRTYLHRLSQ